VDARLPDQYFVWQKIWCKTVTSTTWICSIITERRQNHAHEEAAPSGRVVRQECIEPLGLTVTEAAKRLGVTRQALNNLVNGKGGISAEMAVRVSKVFGSSPEVWLGMQMEYDLAQVEKEAHNIKVRRVV
jgi:antitoxin HigA-1